MTKDLRPQAHRNLASYRFFRSLCITCISILTVACGTPVSDTGSATAKTTSDLNAINDPELKPHLAPDAQRVIKLDHKMPLMGSAELLPPGSAASISADGAYASTKDGQQVSGLYDQKVQVRVLLATYRDDPGAELGGTDPVTELLVYDFIIAGARCIPSGPLGSDELQPVTRPCEVHVLVNAADGTLISRSDVWG